MTNDNKTLYYTPNGKLSSESYDYQKIIDTAYETKDEYESGVEIPSAVMFGKELNETRTNFYTALTHAGETPDILKSIGFPDMPLAVSSEHIIKGPKQSALGFHQHDDSHEFLRDIAEALKHPFMITSIYNKEVVERGQSDAINVFTWHNNKLGMFTISPYGVSTGLHHSEMCNSIVKFVEKRPNTSMQLTMLKYVTRYCMENSPGKYLYFDKDLYNSIPAEYKPENYQTAPELKEPEKSIEAEGVYCGKEINMKRSEKELNRHTFILATSISQTIDYLTNGEDSKYPYAGHKELEKTAFEFAKLPTREKTPEKIKEFTDTLRAYLPDESFIKDDERAEKSFNIAKNEMERFIDTQIARDPVEREYVRIINDISKNKNIEFNDNLRDQMALIYTFPSVPEIANLVTKRICSVIPEAPTKGMCAHTMNYIKESVNRKVDKTIEAAYETNPIPEQTAKYYDKLINVASGHDKEFNKLKQDFIKKCRGRDQNAIADAKSKLWGYLNPDFNVPGIMKGARKLQNEVKGLCLEQIKVEIKQNQHYR